MYILTNLKNGIESEVSDWFFVEADERLDSAVEHVHAADAVTGSQRRKTRLKIINLIFIFITYIKDLQISKCHEKILDQM